MWEEGSAIRAKSDPACEGVVWRRRPYLGAFKPYIKAPK